MKTIALFLALLFITCDNSAQNIEGKINIGTHSLHYLTYGQGLPAIVIDVGVADSYKSWQRIIAELSKTTKVFVYDRAGYGESDPGPMPRDCKQSAGELKILLEKAVIDGPFLLIGHSLGALNMQLFADLFPERVAGLVLLDPSPKGWLSGSGFNNLRDLFNQVTRQFDSLAKSFKNSDKEADRKQSQFFKAIYSEHKELFGKSIEQLNDIKSFNDIPMTVIASGKPNPMMGKDAEPYQKFWIEENRKLSKMSTKGKCILIENSTHQIHIDQPDSVIQEIKILLRNYKN